ncbi:MAG: hypothetical protein ACYDBB_17250 [Armatimonadota bacterium]
MTRFTADVFHTRDNSTHRRLFQCFAILIFIAVTCLLVLTRASAADPVDGKADTAIVATCREDLAQRLKVPVKDIEVIEAQAKVWPDAALGMPEQGKMYAQVLTPGWRIVLEARNTRYLYTASDRAFKFGGPLALWDSSTLYLLPVPNEPNLNGDLYQCSMIGTHHVRLASGVESYYPQAKGVVLFTRRTSRSGYDLLSVKAGEGEKAQRLHAAYYIGEAALNEAQDTWAAFVRPGMGSGWKVAVARSGQENPIMLPVPDGVQPQRIVWSGERVMIRISKGKGMACFETIPTGTAPAWKALDNVQFEQALGIVMNKSTWLEIEQTGTKEKPSVEVATVWFTGDREAVATISGLTLRGYDLFGGYAFVWGEQNNQAAAYTVRISTGEVTPGFHGACQDIKLFKYPPIMKP